MSIIITAPISGSLKIRNTSASPQSLYLCNLKSITVNGDNGSNNVNILNQSGQPLIQIPISQITTIGASGGIFTSMQNAVDAIASLIIV